MAPRLKQQVLHGKANKRQETYRQRHFGRLAKLANGQLWLNIGRDAQATHAIIYLHTRGGAGHRLMGRN
jgi:hypothetical protein